MLVLLQKCNQSVSLSDSCESVGVTEIVTVSDVKCHTHPNQALSTARVHFHALRLNTVHLCEQPSIWKCLIVSQSSIHPRGVNSVYNVHSLIRLCISAGWAAWAGFVKGKKKMESIEKEIHHVCN